MAKRRLFSIALMAISLVLMALPNGIPMTFSVGPTESKTVCYSYFRRIPYSCGNIFPMITAALFIVIVVLAAVGLKRNLNRAAAVTLCTAMASSLASWLLFRTLCQIGLVVFLLHLAVLANLGMERLQNKLKLY